MDLLHVLAAAYYALGATYYAVQLWLLVARRSKDRE